MDFLTLYLATVGYSFIAKKYINTKIINRLRKKGLDINHNDILKYESTCCSKIKGGLKNGIIFIPVVNILSLLSDFNKMPQKQLEVEYFYKAEHNIKIVKAKSDMQVFNYKKEMPKQTIKPCSLSNEVAKEQERVKVKQLIKKTNNNPYYMDEIL